MSNRFLDIFGMEHYHQLIKPKKVQSTNTEASTAWTGEIDASGLAIGKMILYCLQSAETAAGDSTTLNLTLSDGTTTGPKPVKTLRGDNVRASYPQGSILLMVYDGADWIVLSGPERVYQKFFLYSGGTVTTETFTGSSYMFEEGDQDLIEVYVGGKRKFSSLNYTATVASDNSGIIITFETAQSVGPDNGLTMILRK